MYEVLLVFGVVLWLLAIAVYLRQPCASMFHPATYYILIHGIVFVIRPILAWHYDFRGMYYAYEFMPSQHTKNVVLAGADLGFVTFMAAVLYWGGLPMRFARMPVAPAARAAMIKAFLVIAAIGLPLAVLSTKNNIDGKVGDTTTMIRDAATGYAVNTSGNGYFQDVSLMLLPILVAFVWLMRFRLWSMIPFVMGVILRAATGSRWPFVMAFFSLCLFYLYERRGRWINIRLIGGVALVGLLFTTIGADRGAGLRTLFGGHAVQAAAPDKQRPLESMDYANMEFFEYLVDVIPQKTKTYDYFLDNLQILTEPIPRVLWSGKPIGPPIQLYSLYDYGYPIGMTNSVPGEGWAQLGWIGIVLWCGLFGYGYGRLYDAFMRSSQTPVQVALYCTFMPLSIAVFRDGFLLTMLKTSLFTIMPFLLWGMALRLIRWSPQPRRGAAQMQRAR